ncbi:MAG: type II toxin-antitoxin system VapC family toxin [Candidatus Rokubacteria bacterium]|nr:type II toxin-antitoxin system VapC family toxin [Candidatus Rokubacteria bacterium]
MTGELVYLDSSAIVKLTVAEPESVALFAWLADHPGHVTSALARMEVRRALRRAGATAAALRRATSVLEAIAAVPVDRAVIEAAGELDPPELRSLDAIHLATALSVGADLAGIVTYDERLAAAAVRARLEVWAPGAEAG